MNRDLDVRLICIDEATRQLIPGPVVAAGWYVIVEKRGGATLASDIGGPHETAAAAALTLSHWLEQENL